MAISKLKSGNYQARLRDNSGTLLTATFPTKAEATEQVWDWKKRKRAGSLVTTPRLTLDAYATQWWKDMAFQASVGHRREQLLIYNSYVKPHIGSLPLKVITPSHIASILSKMAALGKSEATRRHVYGLLRKLFKDAIEVSEVLTVNPVKASFKPKVINKEPAYLSLEQSRTLLRYVKGKEYGLAIWMQFYLGLRVSELTALRWDDVHLETGLVVIARSYSRADTRVLGERVFKDRPKGGRQHTQRIPPELLALLRETKAVENGDWVAAPSRLLGNTATPLGYEHYLRTLKRYCVEVSVPLIGTHGLRHSTSNLYRHHGATREDMKELFKHSSSSMTKRYDHYLDNNLHRVARSLCLFPKTKKGPRVTTKSDHAEPLENLTN